MSTDHQRISQRNKLLPHVVDDLARELPDAKYGEWVTGTQVVAITYAQLGNIVDGLAACIVEQLGGSGYLKPQRDVLTYVGPNDVRYTALVLAAVKAGYVLFTTSPRNSQSAQQALFERLDCQTLITTEPPSPPALAVLDAVKPPNHLKVPSVEELLSTKYPEFKWEKTFEQVKDDPFVIMHTSGTTGIPKPMIWSHLTCVKVLAAQDQNPPEGAFSVERELLDRKRIVVTLPPFHGASLSQLFFGAIPYGNVIIAPVAAAIPTAQGVVDAIKQAPADVAILVPFVVAELAQNPELLDYCAKNLGAILYIGGDLPQEIGDTVANKIYLRCQWGSTETGIVPQLLSPDMLPQSQSHSNLWRHVWFHPCVGAIFDKVTDDSVELVVRRQKALVETQPCFTIPGIDSLEKEYRTKDLFERHPALPDLWRWRARADDIIVFLTGEKTNPISMEQHIVARNSELSGALVIGAQRFQAALLLEPASMEPLTTSDEAALVERVWPSVEEANRSAPAHARVEKSFILVVPVDRRLIRAGKGTYVRGPSIQQYTKEIEDLYASSDAAQQEVTNGNEEPMYALGPEDVVRLIRKHALAVTGWNSINDNDNFFDGGMDSLQGLRLSRALRSNLHRHDLALSTVYQYPSVSKLASWMSAGRDTERDERELMKELLSAYHRQIEAIPVPSTVNQRTSSSGKINVLLTGSTGTLGTYLLHSLLNHTGIDHIYCVNRRKDGGLETQLSGFANVDLPTTAFDAEKGSRVTFIRADLQMPNLGLDDTTYKTLESQIGLIVHAAWPVNFHLTLSGFRPHLAGVVNLAGLAAGASAHIVFISSIAAVEGYIDGPAPEHILDSLDTPAALGYGRSKFLAEQLMDAAARHFKLQATIVRVGQVGGSIYRPGIWNTREWLPSLVISSLYLGKLPNSLGSRFDVVDFIPADALSGVLIDLAAIGSAPEQDAIDGAKVFNLRNPQLTSWKDLLPAILNAAAAQKRKLEVVTSEEWLAALQASSDEYATTENPAVKLIDFYRALLASSNGQSNGKMARVQPMAVDKASRASPTLHGMEAVKPEWIRKWADEWFATLE